VGAGLQLPSVSCPTVSHTPSSPYSTGSEGGISCKQGNFVINTLLKTSVLDYTAQDGLPLGTWSP
jgi:hypothetical protein